MCTHNSCSIEVYFIVHDELTLYFRRVFLYICTDLIEHRCAQSLLEARNKWVGLERIGAGLVPIRRTSYQPVISYDDVIAY